MTGFYLAAVICLFGLAGYLLFALLFPERF